MLLCHCSPAKGTSESPGMFRPVSLSWHCTWGKARQLLPTAQVARVREASGSEAEHYLLGFPLQISAVEAKG